MPENTKTPETTLAEAPAAATISGPTVAKAWYEPSERHTKAGTVCYWRVGWRDIETDPVARARFQRSTYLGRVDLTPADVVATFAEILTPYTRRVGGQLPRPAKRAIINYANDLYLARQGRDHATEAGDTVAAAAATTTIEALSDEISLNIDTLVDEVLAERAAAAAAQLAVINTPAPEAENQLAALAS